MPVTIYKRGAVWHYRGTAAGRRLRGTTGTADKALAQRIASEAERRVWRSHLDGPGAHVTFAQASIAYRQAEKPTRFLDKIEDHWRDTPIRDITDGAIRQAAIKLYPQAKGATRNRQVIVPTQAIINHAASLDWCRPIKVKRFPVETKTKIPADAKWIGAFAAQAMADKLPHLGALALFMFACGSRISETLRITWADVDLSGRTATIRMTKPTPWTRTAHLPQPVVLALASIGGNRNPEDQVFPYAGRASVKGVWQNVATRAGIPLLTPHCCRHGFATAMLRAGRDVVTVAKMGGWRDVTTLLKSYGHAIEDITVTDVLFDTDLTQDARTKLPTNRKQRKNSR